MASIILKSDLIHVEVDSQSGTCIRLSDPEDAWNTNWIDPCGNWGEADVFSHVETIFENGIAVTRSVNVKERLELVLERSVTGGHYQETYRLRNTGNLDFFMTRDNFGIHYGYNCLMSPRDNLLHDCCVTNIWCGGANSWLYSSKPDGSPRHLVCMLADGELADYSIDYDGSRVCNASHWRGWFILHPADAVIAPGETLLLRFVYAFCESHPDEQLLPELGQRVFPEADCCSAFAGEVIHCHAQTPVPASEAHILANGTPLPFHQDGCHLDWEVPAEQPGEITVRLCIDGDTSLMRLNVLPIVGVILTRRVRFIMEKQQFHHAGSHFDGAYMIYDRVTGKIVNSNTFADSNAARERIAMGVIAAIELQRHPTPELETSLKQYRAFVEREIFDTKTAVVFNGPNRDASWNRAYNYPWLADFYLEYYRAIRDPQCLRNAAAIMLSYYDLIRDRPQESIICRPLDIIRSLEDAGEKDLWRQLRTEFLCHADSVVQRGNSFFSEEVSCTQATFALKCITLCQAFMLTGDRKYTTQLGDFRNSVLAFVGFQPDFRCWGQGIHHWDLYWFGKMKSYGDTFPQWTSTAIGEAFCLMGKVLHSSELLRIGKLSLRSALCLYDQSGFASASYLYPYRVSVHYPDGALHNTSIPEAITYGKRADDWANDQDWSLAVLLTNP